MPEILVVPPGAPRGRFRPPGDKSISHRAALILSLAEGEGRIRNFLSSGDTNATLGLLKAFGVPATREGEALKIFGRGPGSYRPGEGRWPVLVHCANSGTTMRLGAGIAAGMPIEAEFVGDESLSNRPMDRIVGPLREMGARAGAREDRFPPLRIRGGRLKGIRHVSPVASAQVKSAVLLAGLAAEGATEVVEPALSRDHTERLLKFLGVAVEEAEAGGGARIARLKGPAVPRAAEIEVPGDPSAAAFLLAAAAAVPGAEVAAEGISVNPTRTAYLDVLVRMGAAVVRENEREVCGEPVADVTVRGAALKATEIGGAEVPRLIDEIPALVVAFAAAEGTTRVRDAKELRVKETDRIAALVETFGRIGVEIAPAEDGFSIVGPARPAGGRADARGDHRIAMALAAAGAIAEAPVEVEGAEAASVSYPDFAEALRAVGLAAEVRTAEPA